MIAQTTFNIKEDSLYNTLDDFYINWGKDYMNYKRFGVGNYSCVNNTIELIYLEKILCNKSCIIECCEGSKIREKIRILVNILK